MLREIEQRQSALIRAIRHITEELSKWITKPRGRVIGVNIPDDIRTRLDEQISIWEAVSLRQMVLTCIVLGLERVEEVGKIKKKAKREPIKSDPPPKPAPKSSKIRQFREEIYDPDEEILEGGTEDPVEEVQEVLGSDDKGDDGPVSPDGGEGDISHGPGLLVDGHGGDGG